MIGICGDVWVYALGEYGRQKDLAVKLSSSVWSVRRLTTIAGNYFLGLPGAWTGGLGCGLLVMTISSFYVLALSFPHLRSGRASCPLFRAP